MAHIVATRSHDEIVTDKAMDYPRDFRTNKRNTTGLGHQEAGGTICIHSFAVHPKLQGCGLGKLLLKSYLQQLRNSECALRCSLICRDVSTICFSSLFLLAPTFNLYAGRDSSY